MSGTGPTSKKCSTCAEVKTVSEFGNNRAARDGLASACKACANERARRAYAANREAHRASARRDYAKHRETRVATRRAWREANPNYGFSRNLGLLYGMTYDDYEALNAQQGGRCGCCGTTEPGGRDDNERFYVDHDHNTGAVRGLLCHKCNMGIGLLGDDVDGLTAALAYLLGAHDVIAEAAHGSV